MAWFSKCSSMATEFLCCIPWFIQKQRMFFKKSTHSPGNNHTITSNLWNIFLKAESQIATFLPQRHHFATYQLRNTWSQPNWSDLGRHMTLFPNYNIKVDVIIVWFQGPWATRKREGITRILNKHLWKDVTENNVTFLQKLD